MNANGSSVSSPCLGSAAFPAWSPDRTKLAFMYNQSGNYEIFAMNRDFSDAPGTRLTNTTAFNGAPDWQPVVHNYARPQGATPLRVSLTPA